MSFRTRLLLPGAFVAALLAALPFILPTRTVTAQDAPPTATAISAEPSLSREGDNRMNMPVHATARLRDVRSVDDSVRSFRVAPGLEYTASEFFVRLGRDMGLGDDDRMALLPGANATQSIGHCQSHRFQQYHRDVPVLKGFYALVTCADRVVAGTGMIQPGLDVAPAPQVTPGAALAAVQSALSQQNPGIEIALSAPTRLAIHVPAAGEPGSPVLVYRLLVASRAPPRNREILIDAASGAIVRMHDLTRGIWNDVIVSDESQYDGIVEFFAQQDEASGQVRLVSQDLITLETKDAKLGSTLANSDHIFLGSGPAASPADVQKAGVGAHWAAHGAVSYFAENFQWIGADNAAAKLRIFLRLHYPANIDLLAFGENSAGWFGPDPFDSPQSGNPSQWQVIALNLGDGVSYHPLVAPEILAHEFTHAIQYFQIGFLGGFANNVESGGLGESYADIFGVLAESHLRQLSVDYLIGNGWSLSTQRRMDDPSMSVPPQPVQYNDALWNAPPPPPPPPGVLSPHYWSGPHNRWFYLLAEGESQIVGIGPEKAGAIAFFAMTQLMFPDAQYLDALAAEALTAELLFGQHTQPVASVLDAYAAINIGAGYVNTLIHQPAFDAQNVEPWPVELGWEALGEEVEWEVQISADPGFVTEVASRKILGPPNAGLVQLTTLQRPNLQPDTEYHWRVRGRTSGAEWQDWRLPVRFLTAKKMVEPISPMSRERKEFHPWELKFEWKSVPNALKYELQVTESTSSPIDWNDPLLSPDPVSGTSTSMVLDVRVDRDHVWRIRARGPDSQFGPTHGAWIEIPFATTLPRVELLEPLDGDLRYPWPTDLHWAEVTGADHYLIDLTDCDGVFKSANPNSPLPCAKENPDLDYGPLKLDPHTLHFPLNVQPEWSHDHMLYWWQVRVVGPPPWFDEGGLPLEKGMWTVDGDDTIPKQVEPPFAPAKLPCIDLNQNVNFAWEPVPNAVSYRFSLRELVVDPNASGQSSFTLERGAQVFGQTVSGTTISPASVGAGPMSQSHHLGYWWHVESDGPDGYRGLEDSFGSPYLIENDTPTANMDQGHRFALDDDVILSWQSGHTMFADYIVSVHLGANCFPVNQTGKELIPGFSPGKSSAIVDTQNMVESELYSWKVSNAYHITDSQCAQSSKTSDCISFYSPGPVCGNGIVEGKESCDDGNLATGDGCSATCEAALACGQQVGDAGGIELAYEDQEISLGGNKGTVWITAQTYTIPDHLIFKHNGQVIAEVACAGTFEPETVPISINGGSSSIFVTVDPDCNAESTGTKWAYSVSCVDDNAGLPEHVPE